MIFAEVVRQSDGRILRFLVRGHAGAADGWKAVVCSAASTLSQTAVLGIEELVGVAPRVVVRDGYLSCVLPPGMGAPQAARVADIVGTMWLGFRALAEMHPDLVRVREIVEPGGEGNAQDQPAPVRPQEGHGEFPERA